MHEEEELEVLFSIRIEDRIDGASIVKKVRPLVRLLDTPTYRLDDEKNKEIEFQVHGNREQIIAVHKLLRKEGRDVMSMD